VVTNYGNTICVKPTILNKLIGYYTYHYVMKCILLFEVPVNLDQDVTKTECKNITTQFT